MYESYFGLHRAPFGVTPDPRFLYRTARYEEAFATLLYGIRERKGFVTLTGEAGTGKTTLLHAVITELGETPFVFVFNPVADFDQLLAIICDELGLEPGRPDRPARLAALNRFLTAQLRAGRTTVLLIDEAQNLSPQTLEDLRQLSNLETPTEKLLQIVLAGQPELAARLADPSLRQLRQRVALRQELRPLSPREVGDFVRHRLRAAGALDESVITPGALSRIVRFSAGIPRLVNVICDNALLVCYGLSQRSVTAAMVDEVADDLGIAPSPAASGQPLDRALREVEIAASARRSAARSSKGPLVASGIATLILFSGMAAALSSREAASRFVGWNQGARRVAASAPEVAPRAQRDAPPSAPEASRPANAKLDVPYGTTLLEIVGNAYGPYCRLALDLVPQANPGVRNFEMISSGQPLTLPTLEQAALMQTDKNGSSRLVVGVYFQRSRAARVAKAFRKRTGLDAEVVTRPLSPRLSLYRVDVTDLDAEDVARAWRHARAMHLVPGRLEPFGNGPVQRATCSDADDSRVASR